MAKKISVKVKTNCKTEKIERIGQNSFIIWTKEPAKEEKANKAIIKTLSKFLKVPSSQITLLTGRHSKEKIFNIE
ncbi:DUF167 domain-containing protein [Patescibacteria group bacterium]|nr:DUF167 domain-containing protein [Patescibacteria group bacterium]MBU2633077.1 DUF167 domain-containing protein [Patescibacteria group bacterium]